jgi:hypothetical protein
VSETIRQKSPGALERVRSAWTRFGAARVLPVLAVSAFVFGVIARAEYVLRLHHPRHFVVSDAANLMGIARRLLTEPSSQTISDTIWPPGAPALLALWSGIDPTLGAAAWLQLALSALVPLLVCHATYVSAGPRAASVALIAASLHFGFIHYAGFVLSEQLFQFAVSLALWASLVALRLAEARFARPPLPRDGVPLALIGAGAGACWALATSLRPNALPVAGLVAAALGVYWWRRRERRAAWLLAGGLFALCLGLAPLAARCTRLSSAFCPVSNNVAMNMVLGQAGDVMGIYFKNPAHPELDSGWVPPALLQHGYTRTRDVNFSIYDTRQAFAWFARRFIEAPGSFLLRAFGNALDLFRFEYWPDDPGAVDRRFVTVAKQAFFLGVLAPGLVGCALAVRRVQRRPSVSAVLVFVALLPLALCFVAAFSLGEPRYRIPFDAVFILLAAALYSHVSPGARRFTTPGSLRAAAPLLATCGGAALALLGLIALVSHPAVGLATRLGLDSAATATRIERRLPDDFGALKTRGASWDAPGSQRFSCTPRCSELRVTFAGPLHARRVELALDHNDAYQVSYYRGDALLARARVEPGSRGPGLRLERVITPDAADGFDTLGVLPLYGDGKYALGHVRLLSP